MDFDLPFIPDQAYVQSLQARASQVHSLYFSLHARSPLDARPRSRIFSAAELSARLQALPETRKYGLLNGRFQCPDSYSASSFLQEVIEVLDRLNKDGNLDGIVYVDHYLLQALSDAAPELASGLEAVPGLNCMLDSVEKIQFQLEFIAKTNFQEPGKLLLDRSLNRSFAALEKVGGEIRKRWPRASIGLLANEGCLPHCPFKLTHDAHISLANLHCGQDRTAEQNARLGCARLFVQDPSLIIRSPFIRPEDVQAYSGVVDFIKLSGRTRGPEVMGRIFDLYLRQRYDGNLLELMDTLEFLAGRFNLPNQDLPDDFLRTVATCSKDCRQCGTCQELSRRLIQDRGVAGLRPMWV
jgi:hypothetical protein